ncbi:hypothetical protein [Azospirillum doebereinerae]|uniref:Uncharacterized protein n=1 Tax=Azospirillum doebereinerae TaxID=92933 RepID=A0A3S0WI15_9PROT|nr:hypothetical protein [Azospirillum doebereinerae]MCG5242247.1 hypothetical protein [Azospirillum doebereinerae]RUQ61433.1 hypothetical protein EJ913_29620 [Azospirillum doebereinerae]
MLLYNALASVVLEAARLDRPCPKPVAAAEPRPFRLSHNPVPPAPRAATPVSTPVSTPASLAPVRLFGRLLVEE